MTRRLLQQTKDQFVTFCNLLPDAAWYEIVTTSYNGKTEIARFRRMFIRTVNNVNHRALCERMK